MLDDGRYSKLVLNQAALAERIAQRKAEMGQPEHVIRNTIGYHFLDIQKVDECPNGVKKIFKCSATQATADEMKAVRDFASNNNEYAARAYSIRRNPVTGEVQFALYMQERKPVEATPCLA